VNKIVGVKFYKEHSGSFEGREYNYYDGLGDLAIGDIAVADVRDKEKLVLVTAVDVPESKIDERILLVLQTLSKRHVPPAPVSEESQQERFS